MTDEEFRAEIRTGIAADIAGRKRDDGGMAFPGFEYVAGHGSSKQGLSEQWENYQTGMTLRAYFAGKALEGSLANPSAVFTPSKAQMDSGVTWTQIMAKECVEAADALIKELSK
jgi:hypothetical protein